MVKNKVGGVLMLCSVLGMCVQEIDIPRGDYSGLLIQIQ